MRTVNVKKDYKSEFDNIFNLLSEKCFGDDYAVKADGDNIKDGDIVYILSGSRRRESADKVAYGFTDEGANWFAQFRDKNIIKSDEVLWNAFVERFAKEFHKRYGILEYERTASAGDSENDYEHFKAIAGKILKVLFKRKEEFEFKRGNKTQSDIYYLTLRLSLSGEANAAQTILCRLYFEATRDGHVLIPMKAEDAKKIELPNVTKENNNEARKGGTDIKEKALNALKKIINEPKEEGEFENSIVFCDEKKDSSIVKKLISRNAHSENVLVCKGVKVLGITHIKYERTSYNISVGGGELFMEVLGENQIRLECNNCKGDDRVIIDNNIIKYFDENGKPQQIVLDFNKSDLGLADKADEVFTYSNVKDHIRAVKCPKEGDLKECGKTKCKGQFIEIQGIGGEIKCADCPYPERVYFDENGDPQKTGSMKFDNYSLKFTVEKTGVCACCGRCFKADLLKKGKGNCPTCAKAGKKSCKEEGKKNFDKYDKMLPITKRMSARRLCFEDAGAIIFFVGKHVYSIDKTEMNDDGYLASPKKIK